VAVMSKGNSMERARMMSALGAEVVLVDQLPDSTPGQVSGGDLEKVEQEAQKIVAEKKAFRADQFHLEGNTRAHALHTGPEIIRQTNGEFDAFCDYVGTGGSFAFADPHHQLGYGYVPNQMGTHLQDPRDAALRGAAYRCLGVADPYRG